MIWSASHPERREGSAALKTATFFSNDLFSFPIAIARERGFIGKLVSRPFFELGLQFTDPVADKEAGCIDGQMKYVEEMNRRKGDGRGNSVYPPQLMIQLQNGIACMGDDHEIEKIIFPFQHHIQDRAYGRIVEGLRVLVCLFGAA